MKDAAVAKMETEIGEIAKPGAEVDLIADSINHPLAVVFSQSSSPNYLLAVETAQKAHKYHERIEPKKTRTHLAVFSSDRVQLSRALHLLGYVKGLKSTRLFAGGKMLPNAHVIEEVLSCYLTALRCNNWRAHCHKVVSEPWVKLPSSSKELMSMEWVKPPPAVKSYLVPCALVAAFGGSQVALEKTSFAATKQEKIQAIGVRRGCDWCPNFRPNEFKEL